MRARTALRERGAVLEAREREKAETGRHEREVVANIF
jgi:hypothetical protein